MPLCHAETLDLSSGCSPAVCFVFLSRQRTQGHRFTDQGTEAKAGILSLHHLILIKALPLPGDQPPALSTRVYQQDRLPHGKCELSAGEGKRKCSQKDYTLFPKKTLYVVYSWAGGGGGGPPRHVDYQEETLSGKKRKVVAGQQGVKSARRGPAESPEPSRLAVPTPPHPARVCPLHLPRPRCGSILNDTDGLFSCWEEASTKYITKKKFPWC